tara:strand:- start:6755 stop:7690 length:936 start_codon:yes stop_codon:yes gene_type:complete
MNYKLTIFKNRYDNVTSKTMCFNTWHEFVSLLNKLAKVNNTKATAPLISPAIYTEETTRSNKNVEVWAGWCALDVDDHSFGNDIHVLQSELTRLFAPYDFVCYSTASSNPDCLKFRLVFRIDSHIEREQIPKFWFALNAEVGEIGDAQTKDLSRMYYVPANYTGASNFCFSHDGGSPIDSFALIIKHPYVQKTGNSFLDRLPPEMQKAVVEHRKTSMTTTDIYWTNYKDCPFFPRRLGVEYQTMTETGWYRKMYQIMIAVAGSAIKRGYPITAKQVADMCRQLDNDTGNWYETRPLEVEADRAVEYAYRNN